MVYIPIFCDAFELILRVLSISARDIYQSTIWGERDPSDEDSEITASTISDWRRKCKPRRKEDLSLLERVLCEIIEREGLSITREITTMSQQINSTVLWNQIVRMYMRYKEFDKEQAEFQANCIVYMVDETRREIGYQPRALKDCVVLLLENAYASQDRRQRLKEQEN